MVVTGLSSDTASLNPFAIKPSPQPVGPRYGRMVCTAGRRGSFILLQTTTNEEDTVMKASTRRLACVSTAVTLVAAATAVPAWAISWGEVDTENCHPNVCAVVALASPEQGWGIRIASGTLIHPRVVLTAGHVTHWFAEWWDVPPDRVRVSFAANALDEKSWLEV